jgi:hypothetical protein
MVDVTKFEFTPTTKMGLITFENIRYTYIITKLRNSKKRGKKTEIPHT